MQYGSVHAKSGKITTTSNNTNKHETDNLQRE